MSIFTKTKSVLISKINFVAGLLMILLSTGSAHALNGHEHHPPHNMILLGITEVFASHIVYKHPHNYQVILKIQFDSKTLETYQATRVANTDSLFIFLLDSMDIAEIQTMDSISGKLLFEDAEGKRNVVLEGITVDKNHFKVVYFDEVPLSLEKMNP